jgi:hypothetical protein
MGNAYAYAYAYADERYQTGSSPSTQEKGERQHQQHWYVTCHTLDHSLPLTVAWYIESGVVRRVSSSRIVLVTTRVAQ